MKLVSGRKRFRKLKGSKKAPPIVVDAERPDRGTRYDGGNSVQARSAALRGPRHREEAAARELACDAIDDGHQLIAIVDQIKVGGLLRRRAKFVSTRIAVLDHRERPRS